MCEQLCMRCSTVKLKEKVCKQVLKNSSKVELSGPDTPKRKEMRMDVVHVDICIHCGSKILL